MGDLRADIVERILNFSCWEGSEKLAGDLADEILAIQEINEALVATVLIKAIAKVWAESDEAPDGAKLKEEFLRVFAKDKLQ